MSFEKFVYRHQLVTQCLDDIAARTDASRLFRHSPEFLPQVRELLAAQERLLTAAERLLEQCQDAAPLH